jgi:hypothetical protein
VEYVDIGNLDAKVAALKGKILALAWMMPPLVFPRSLQVSRTLKMLGQLGWETTVVTITPEAEPQGARDERLAGFYAGWYRQLTVDPREEVQRSPWWLRAWRKVSPPKDVRIDNWVRRTSAVLCAEVKNGQYDVMVSFAQPWIDHLVALKLKRKHPSLPWVVHFSDPWVDSPYTHFASAEEKEHAIRQERTIMEAADAIIFVNRYTADLVMAKYPASWLSKVHVLPHGYDNDLLPLVAEAPSHRDVMRVVHTGNFYGHRKPELILKAVAELAESPEIQSFLRVEFVGYVDEQFVLTAREMGLDGIVRFSGKAGYLESLGVAREADLLLLIDAPAEKNVFLPSKIVDYFMLRRPILGITPASGASSEVLRACGCPVVEPDDVAGIASALRTAFERWRAGSEPLGIPAPTGTALFDIGQTTLEFERAIRAAMGAREGSR